MGIRLSEERSEDFIQALQAFYSSEFDEELSRYRADALLKFVLTRMGPPLYNQAVADARSFMQKKLEDLDGEIYQPE
jgi:uncharacterized protein (DUF2164 family)